MGASWTAGRTSGSRLTLCHQSGSVKQDKSTGEVGNQVVRKKEERPLSCEISLTTCWRKRSKAWWTSPGSRVVQSCGGGEVVKKDWIWSFPPREARTAVGLKKLPMMECRVKMSGFASLMVASRRSESSESSFFSSKGRKPKRQENIRATHKILYDFDMILDLFREWRVKITAPCHQCVPVGENMVRKKNP